MCNETIFTGGLQLDISEYQCVKALYRLTISTGVQSFYDSEFQLNMAFERYRIVYSREFTLLYFNEDSFTVINTEDRLIRVQRFRQPILAIFPTHSLDLSAMEQGH
jgi:hypothetical protein